MQDPDGMGETTVKIFEVSTRAGFRRSAAGWNSANPLKTRETRVGQGEGKIVVQHAET
jgi:hypothetical protein